MPSFILKVRCCNFNIDFESAKDAAAFFGIGRSRIVDVCNNRRSTTLKGLVFMYINS